MSETAVCAATQILEKGRQQPGFRNAFSLIRGCSELRAHLSASRNTVFEPIRIRLNWLREAPFGQLCVAILERCLSIDLLLYSRAGPRPHLVVDLTKNSLRSRSDSQTRMGSNNPSCAQAAYFSLVGDLISPRIPGSKTQSIIPHAARQSTLSILRECPKQPSAQQRKFWRKAASNRASGMRFR